MANKKKMIIMRVSVAGSPDLAARGRYELSEKLANELISIGYADEAAPETRRGRRAAADTIESPDSNQDGAEVGTDDTGDQE